MMQQKVDLEESVERALAQAPSVRLPEGFAARVAAAAVAQPLAKARVRRRTISLGRATSVGAMVALTAALFVVAPMAGTHIQSWPFALEMVLLVQLAAVSFGVAQSVIRE